jgi:glycosyltransferase involved in cell wall biosynthesis
VVIIDDGSSDGSVEFLRRYYGGHPKLALSERENRGAHATLNEAINIARGDFVSILNSDDLYEETRIERLIDAARSAGPGPFFGITAVAIIDDEGGPSISQSHAYYQRVCQKVIGAPPSAVFWPGNIAMTTSNFFFSKSAFEAIGPFRSLRYVHDWDWALRASERFGVHRLDEPLLKYRVHSANTISESDIWKHLTENAFLFASALKRMGIDDRAARSEYSSSSVMSYLMKNEHLPVVPTLFMLGLGTDETELERSLASGRLEALVRELLSSSGLPIDVLLSPIHVDGLVTQVARGKKGVRATGKRIVIRLRAAFAQHTRRVREMLQMSP